MQCDACTLSPAAMHLNHLPPLASRSSRFWAAVVDIVVFIVWVATAWIVGTLLDFDSSGQFAAAVLVCGWIGLTVVQTIFLVKRGQSIGKIALNIKIVRRSDGTIPGFAKIVLLRMVVPSLLSAIPVAGFVIFLIDVLFIFREDRRCLHDLLAETVVVENIQDFSEIPVESQSSPDLVDARITVPENSSPPSSRMAAVPQAADLHSSSTSEPLTPEYPTTMSQTAHPLDEELWEIAAEEVAGPSRRAGLWAKAFAESNGDEAQAKVRYLKWRVEQLQHEEAMRQIAADTAKRDRSLVEHAAQKRAAEIQAAKRDAQKVETFRRRMKELDVMPEQDILAYLGAISPVDLPIVLSVRNEVGGTLLHIASREGFEGLTELLLVKGVDPSLPGPDGLLPYQIAARNGHFKLSTWLAAQTPAPR